MDFTSNELAINEQQIQPHIRKQTANGIIVHDRTTLDRLFYEFAVELKEKKERSDNTIRTYRLSLRQWFEYLQQIGDVQPTVKTIYAYKDNLTAQGKQATTIQNYIIAVKQFYKWTASKHVYPNIADGVVGKKIGRSFKKDFLKPEQAKSVLSSIDRSTFIGKRNYAMLVLMLTTGLRTIEVARANIGDLNNLGNSTVLYVQGKGHTEKDDSVRVPDHAEQAVREYLNVRRAKNVNEPLFTSTSNRNENGRMTTRSIRGIIKTIFRNAGFDSPRLTAHSTRHTAATLSLMNGATIQETQHLLRHKNVQTTEIYNHNIEAAKNPASQDVENALFN